MAINMSCNTCCSKKYTPAIFCSFVSNCLEFQSQILRTYAVILCARNSFVSVYTLLSVKFVSSVLKNVKKSQ